MIVRDLTTGGGEPAWQLITQPDHARLAFEILRLWRGAELANHPRRDDILFAAREHDNGWRELDAAPLWNREADRPHDFRTMPTPHRIDLWLRGSERFAESRPYAALLITLHALAINGRGEEDDSGPELAERWNAMIDTLEERRDQLLDDTASPLEQATDDYRFVRFSDTASLTALGIWGDGFRMTVPTLDVSDASANEDLTIQANYDPGEPDSGPPVLRLDPLPLAGATTFRVPARYLPHRDHGDDVDLAVALATARWGETRVRVA